jgi:flagellar basal-body rod protein FlgG
MLRSVYVAGTGMQAQQLNVEVISNNISNMTTTAFTRRRAEFQDLLYQTVTRVGSTSDDTGSIVPAGVHLGLGVRVAATYRITERGNILPTDNTFDLAIQGKGYFQVDLPDGTTGYTRAGAFQLNADGEMVTAQGLTVQPGITVPDDAIDVTVNAAGEVLAQIPGQVALQNLGQISVANFANENGLVPIGDTMFIESEASGAPVTGTPNSENFGPLLQGFLETSNVDAVKEITNLITAQRGYEMNTKVIETADEMWGSLTNLR